MRIRSTKPEFWRSERVAGVSWDARLVLKGLESYVDDNGVGKDDVILIAADLFSRDLARESPGTLKRVSEAITELHEAGFVWRYEVDGTNYLYLSWWESTQYINKPAKGRFPRPDATLGYGDSKIGAPFQKSPGDSGETRAGSGDQGIRGSGEKTSSSASADAEPRRDVDEILDYLDHAIHAADPDARLPNRSQKNHDAARRLLDLDGRTVAQVKAAIDFATRDEFWSANIRSMSKLREKYDQLRAQAQRKRPPQPRDPYANLKVVGADE